ncbi:MAG TPA: GDP-mannose 4,6-dehydratase [Thermoplasmata archaeon]|nr:GDP-mannose 4,6-dehydratase [Thermoplasmata archaeon]
MSLGRGRRRGLRAHEERRGRVPDRRRARRPSSHSGRRNESAERPSGGTALVTGAEGFIGRVLVARLADSGRKVIACHHGEVPGPRPARSASLAYRRLDVTDPGSVRRLVSASAPDEIFHLAAMSLPSISWVEPWETLRVNVQGTVNVLEEARRASTEPRVFIACSSAEYGDSAGVESGAHEESPLYPLHPYGVSKVAQDLLGRQYFRNYGVRALRGRIFNTIGPGKVNDAPSDFASQIAAVEAGRAQAVEVGNLDTRRDFTDVRDMVDGILTTTRQGRAGEAYNLCGGRAISLRTVLETLLSFASAPVPWTVQAERIRPTDEPLILGSNRKVASELGWTPKIPIEETLRSIYDYWHDRPS